MKRFIVSMVICMIPMVSCKSLNDAVIQGDSSSVWKLILAGEDVNKKDKYGKTALMYAAENSKAEIVKILINAKADVNAKDNEGKTALMYAAAGDSLDIVRNLIENKADVEAEDNSGDIALYKSRKKTEVRDELLKYSTKYRSQFLCRINTLFKFLEKYPEITVSYVGKPDSGVGAVYYGDGVRLVSNQGIWPEMVAYLKTYGVVFTEEIYNELGRCKK